MQSNLTTNRQPHILVVDDEENDLRMLHTVLSKKYHCDTTSCIDLALTLMNKRQYELVISNVSMPDAKGFSLLNEIKKKFPLTVVVTVSKTRDFDHTFEAMRHGAFDYLTKPFYLHDIECVVERGLKHQSLLAANRRHEEQLEDWVNECVNQLSEANRQINRMFDSLSVSYRATLQSLTAALEMHDTAGKGHSQRVMIYALRIGQSLNLSRKEMMALEQGALLHDIGKIGVSNHILRKPSPLTMEEWVEMRRHAEYGVEILQNIEFLQEALPVVLQHHENWDGSGYPYGLKGEAIALNARICAVADTVDAITSTRPYRVENTMEAAIAELRLWSGRQFDPRVVESFLAVPVEDWRRLQESMRSNTGSYFENSPQQKLNFAQKLVHEGALMMARI